MSVFRHDGGPAMGTTATTAFARPRRPAPASVAVSVAAPVVAHSSLPSPAEPRDVGGRGRATLVGAGPGSPDLLTLRAARVIAAADVVLFDALIDLSILDLAPPAARRIDVGKRCGRHAMNQTAINALILHHARAGAHVVRLKGGDPFVFGRGGEELDTLRAAGIAVEVVPGVTAACAAAASLQIPLTHRDVARSLHFVTGHGSDGAVPGHDWTALATGGGTICAYMASRTLPTVARRLIAAGMAGSTPAVAVENASRAEERRVSGTLETLPERLAAAGMEGPTIVVVGAVVGLAATAEVPRPGGVSRGVSGGPPDGVARALRAVA